MFEENSIANTGAYFADFFLVEFASSEDADSIEAFFKVPCSNLIYSQTLIVTPKYTGQGYFSL